MSEMWVERHRPQTVADIKGQKAVVDRLKAYAKSRTHSHTSSSLGPLVLERRLRLWPSLAMSSVRVTA